MSSFDDIQGYFILEVLLIATQAYIVMDITLKRLINIINIVFTHLSDSDLAFSSYFLDSYDFFIWFDIFYGFMIVISNFDSCAGVIDDIAYR